MPGAMTVGGVLVIVAAASLAVLALRVMARRPVSQDEVGSAALAQHSSATVLINDKLTQERREEHRDYLRERAKNDRHQDLD